jgi:hypothetical protein
MIIARAASQHQVDVVIDMIAITVETTVPLLNALASTIDRYVLVSSLDVYRNYGGLHRIETPQPIMQPQGEDSPLREQLYPYRVTPRRAIDDPQVWLDNYDKIPIERAVMERSDLQFAILHLPIDLLHNFLLTTV